MISAALTGRHERIRAIGLYARAATYSMENISPIFGHYSTETENTGKRLTTMPSAPIPATPPRRRRRRYPSQARF